MTNYTDYPWDEVVEAAERLIKEKGATLHQKFTCEKCGSRQTMAVPNVFYVQGECEECGFVTDIRTKGCNYLMILTTQGETAH